MLSPKYPSLTLLLIALLLITAYTSNAIVVFHRPEADEIFKNKAEALLLLLGDYDEASDHFDAVFAITNSYPDILFTYLRAGVEPYEKLIELLGLGKYEPPLIVYFAAGGKKYLYSPNQFGPSSKETNVADFIDQAKAGGVSRYLKSGQSIENITEQERAENQKYLTYFDGYSLEKTREESEKELFLMIYASWCEHSRKFAPMFLSLAKILSVNPNMQFGKIEGIANEIHNFEPRGFPMLVHWGKKKAGQPTMYFGNRKIDEILEWIQDKTEYAWVEIEEQKQAVLGIPQRNQKGEQL